MDNREAFDRVVAIIAPFARDREALAKVSEQTLVLQDLRVNSARLVDIVMACEEEFKTTIDDAALEAIRTVGDVVRTVKEKTR